MRNLIFILILGGVILFFAKGNDAPVTITNVRVDTVYQQKTLTKYKKGDSIPFVVLDTLYLIDSMVIHDTVKMVNDYLSVKAYSDTLRINTDNSLYVYDTISQNKIIGRSFIAHLTEKMIEKNTFIERKPKNELFIGLIGDLRRFDQKVGVGVGINYKKQNESYILNFTTNQISLGLYKKLF